MVSAWVQSFSLAKKISKEDGATWYHNVNPFGCHRTNCIPKNDERRAFNVMYILSQQSVFLFVFFKESRQWIRATQQENHRMAG